MHSLIPGTTGSATTTATISMLTTDTVLRSDDQSEVQHDDLDSLYSADGDPENAHDRFTRATSAHTVLEPEHGRAVDDILDEMHPESEHSQSDSASSATYEEEEQELDDDDDDDDVVDEDLSTAPGSIRSIDSEEDDVELERPSLSKFFGNAHAGIVLGEEPHYVEHVPVLGDDVTNDDDDDHFGADSHVIVEDEDYIDTDTDFHRGQVPVIKGLSNFDGASEQLTHENVAQPNSFTPLAASVVSAPSVRSSDSSSGELRPDTQQAQQAAQSAPFQSKIPNPTTAPVPNSKKSASGFSYAMARASATFYKAFRMPKALSVKRDDSPRSSVSASSPPNPARVDSMGLKQLELMGELSEGERKIQERFLKFEQVLKAQIETLNSAKSGFVDLSLLKPMTKRTLQAIENESAPLLKNFDEMKHRARDLYAKIAESQRTADSEIAAKEQLLIAAKLRLAEARAEVDVLRHELRALKRVVNDPVKVAAKTCHELKTRRKVAIQETNKAREKRAEAERKLQENLKLLEREKVEARRLEKKCKDLNGDWTD